MIDESGDCEGIVNLEYPYYGWMCPFEDGMNVSFVGVYEAMQGRGLMTELIEKLQSEYKTVKVPNVVSGRLRNILTRLGFKKTTEPHEMDEGTVEVYVWRNDDRKREMCIVCDIPVHAFNAHKLLEEGRLCSESCYKEYVKRAQLKEEKKS